jgi:hypothetical protein
MNIQTGTASKNDLEFTLECAVSWGIADGADPGSDEFAVYNLALSAGTDPLSAVAS